MHTFTRENQMLVDGKCMCHPSIDLMCTDALAYAWRAQACWWGRDPLLVILVTVRTPYLSSLYPLSPSLRYKAHWSRLPGSVLNAQCLMPCCCCYLPRLQSPPLHLLSCFWNPVLTDIFSVLCSLYLHICPSWRCFLTPTLWLHAPSHCFILLRAYYCPKWCYSIRGLFFLSFHKI